MINAKGVVAFGWVVAIGLALTLEAPVKTVVAQGVSPVGSWYGSADGTALGIPHVYMMPTFFQDGTLIANDIIDKTHTTAHGAWQRVGARGIKATFVWINLSLTDPPGTPAGTALVVLEGTIDAHDQNRMEGKVTARFCDMDVANCSPAVDAPFESLRRIQVQ